MNVIVGAHNGEICDSKSPIQQVRPEAAWGKLVPQHTPGLQSHPWSEVQAHDQIVLERRTCLYSYLMRKAAQKRWLSLGGRHSGVEVPRFLLPEGGVSQPDGQECNSQVGQPGEDHLRGLWSEAPGMTKAHVHKIMAGLYCWTRPEELESALLAFN